MTKGKTEKTRFIIPTDLYNQVKEFEFPGTRITGSTVKNFIASKPDKFTDPEGYIIHEVVCDKYNNALLALQGYCCTALL